MADTTTTFADLGLSLPIVKALTAEGVKHPFPIQAAAIPQAIEGKDILGRGPTGSGKTFTFGLPIIESLQRGASAPKKPRALILVPTRELAAQVRERLEPIANAAGQRILEVVGGVKISRNITALARPVDILVATPGRAQDLLDQRHIDFSDVRVVALDEADQMADMGFLPQVTRLLKRLPRDCQHLLFSATLDGDVHVLVDRFMNNPITHSTGEATASVDSMKHILAVFDDRDGRNQAILDLGKLGFRTVMFVRTKYAVDRQVKKLVRAGVNAVGLHGNKGQTTRTKALESFASGEVSVLVATDIAARGIDVRDVELVVHIDAPAEHKSYVHRAGRTARAGAEGTVITLTFTDTKNDTLKMMRQAGVTPDVVSGPDIAAHAKKAAR
ncbi:DEAD/DEAH box helicase [Corynebacterium auriscanis]|uniref:DEAD/DEAH box helicase n=1 Tax=Corynebacterium auriscanis TaxID=99807 RepID=UPI0024AE58EC|nr:DEAD/DEAH box helicase [Corynebacterium auriscanis]